MQITMGTAALALKITVTFVEQRIHNQVTGEPMKFLSLADWTGIVETELFSKTYRSYGLATVRYPVLEIEGRIEPFENGAGLHLTSNRSKASPPNNGVQRLMPLDGDQLGQLGCDVCHRLFCGAQAGSRGQQGADFAESFIRRLVHDRNELLTREECRKFFVGDALRWEAAQQRRGHQHDTDPRIRQSLVDGAEQRRAEANVFLAEPDLDTA